MNDQRQQEGDEESKLVAELKMLVEVNKRLARDLIECRLELERLKARAR